jgi:hypothetical protein
MWPHLLVVLQVQYVASQPQIIIQPQPMMMPYVVAPQPVLEPRLPVVAAAPNLAPPPPQIQYVPVSEAGQ